MSDKSLTIKQHHINLLKRANISLECGEWSVPGFDTKRPYGNSDMIDDVYEIIKGKRLPDDEREKVYKPIEDLQKEMVDVLEILCHHPEGIKVGDVFIRKNYEWGRK